MSRKEREREFKRSEILSAALELFAAKGFINTTLDEIAEKSEFGKGTIYNYFQNKEEIYTAIVENVFNDFLQNFRSIDLSTVTFREFTTQVIRFMFSYCFNNQAAFKVMAHKRLEVIGDTPHPFSDNIKKVSKQLNSIQTRKLEKAIENGEIKGTDSQKLIALIRGTVFSYIHHEMVCSKVQNINIDEETEYLTSIIFNGIINPAERK
ncbi:MAG: TetR/AcrR family transcriptional regulator [Melioribacteraceae bacterium]|nr:TetR/AcrR family transcriptional regulator [Melioribacteraceae bacterium]